MNFLMQRDNAMSPIDLMVFDLDGTIVDSSPDLIAAVNFARAALKLAALTDEAIISFVGDGLDKLVERFLGPEQKHCQAEARAIFMEYYGKHLADKTVLCPGVLEVMKFFGNKKKLLITNKDRDFTRRITDHFKITACFEEIIGMGSTAYRKPEALILFPALSRLRIDPQHTVVIGDGVADIKLAKNTGSKSCAMLNGFTSRATLLALQPDFACESLWELKEILC